MPNGNAALAQILNQNAQISSSFNQDDSIDEEQKKKNGNPDLAQLLKAPAPVSSSTGNAMLTKLLGPAPKPSTDNPFGALGPIPAIASAVSTALSKKTVPPDFLNTAALGLGLAQGWCGVYASKISTAAAVGDTWASKLATAQKSGTNQQVDVGYKVVIPLGVKNAATDYGHVIVAVTKPDSNGNFLAVQSNADGRQNKGDGLGVATPGIFNINDLNKQYGSNWGSVKGQLKVNPYANGKNAIPVSAATGNGDSEVQPGGPLLPKSNQPNWLETMATNAVTTAAHVLPIVPAPVKPTAKVTDDQAPPIALNIDKDPQVLAQYVLKNKVTDLQNKQWWIESPVKGAAWDLINQAKGQGDTGARFVVDQHQQLSAPQQPDAIRGALKIMGFDAPGLQQTGDLLKSAGKAVSDYADQQPDISFTDPIGSVIGKAGIKGIGNSLMGIGEGSQDLAGTTGNSSVAGLGKIFFGGAGFTGGGAIFNTVTNLPVVKDVANAVFGAVENYNQGVLQRASQGFVQPGTANTGAGVEVAKNNFIDLLHLGLQVGEFGLAHEVLTGAQDAVLNKSVEYTPDQLNAAFQDVVSDQKSPNVSDSLRAKAQDLIEQAANGVKQMEKLVRSTKEGVTVKEARDFTGWFNDFFKKAPKDQASPEFSKLIDDGKKSANGTLSPVQFFSEAKEIMAKGESATLRDNLAQPSSSSPDALIAGSDGKTPIQTQSEQQARLSDLQQAGARPVVSVDANGQQALEIQTYTASDGKTSVGFTIETDQGKTMQPISGVYDNPREAVKAAIPQIEQAIGSNSDVASTAIRTQIHDLQSTGFKDIPAKGEVLPWEDNYVPDKPTVDTKSMSKEELQKAIDARVKDYVDNVLKPTGYKGVTQGSIARDEVTGDVVGRQGRISNNPEWYQKAVKENGGAQPSAKQLKEIAVDHLLNGTQDHSIGDLPPDKEFQKLTQALTIAKSEKVPVTQQKTGEMKGTGETKVRGLSLGVEAKAVEHGLTERMSGLPEYKTVNMEDQAQKAQKFLEENPDLARKVAMGEERPPKDILPESVFIAVENEAIKNGDIATLTDLAQKSGLSAEATTMGQRLRTLAERDPESPVGAFESVIRAREQALEKRLAATKERINGKKVKGPTLAKATEDVAEDIQKSIKKSVPTKKEWSTFIDTLRC